MKRKKWYCYVCGNKLQKSYYLCSMNDSTDRVFLLCKNKLCIDRVNSQDILMIEVIEIKRRTK